MRQSVTGSAKQTRVHSGVVFSPKPLLGVLVALVVFCFAFPSITPGGTTRTTTAHSASASASKKKPSKKRRKSSRQSSQKAPTADRITEIQSALSRSGYLQGDPTGKWDSTTVVAMQKFQSSNGLEANGKLDALSLQKLGLGSDIAGVSAPKPVAPHGSASLMLPSPGPSASMVSPASQALPATSTASNLHGSSSVAVSTAASR
jgi:peptidoglycan hydrolase-like protein with peptidoglycan-binding domain